MKRWVVAAVAGGIILFGIGAATLLWSQSGARAARPVQASVGEIPQWPDCKWALAVLDYDRKADQDSADHYAEIQNFEMATYYHDWAQRWFLAYNYAQWKCGGDEGVQPVEAARIIDWFRYAGQTHLYLAMVPGSTPEWNSWNLHWGLAYMRLQRVFAEWA
jgi:hypothetical protein